MVTIPIVAMLGLRRGALVFAQIKEEMPKRVVEKLDYIVNLVVFRPYGLAGRSYAPWPPIYRSLVFLRYAARVDYLISGLVEVRPIPRCMTGNSRGEILFTR
jgi:hypothetical protein